VAHDEAGSAGAAAARPGAARLHSLASETALVADLSYLRCWEGVAYFAFVLDAFSRMVVGWQLAAHMRTHLVLDALKMALGCAEPAPTSNSSTTGSVRKFVYAVSCAV